MRYKKYIKERFLELLKAFASFNGLILFLEQKFHF